MAPDVVEVWHYTAALQETIGDLKLGMAIKTCLERETHSFKALGVNAMASSAHKMEPVMMMMIMMTTTMMILPINVSQPNE